MNKSALIMRDQYIEWVSKLYDKDISEADIFVLLEDAFTQGYISASQQNQVMVTISDEEKEALSGWVDLEEIR